MKVIFMGTPKFALPALQKLIDDDHFEIVGVFAKEPKIAGRGQKITNCAVHDLALKHNLKVFTPKTLRDAKVQENFRELNAEIALVVAYGLILPKEILESTKFGVVNIHPSILPKYRGATPIQSTIWAGDSEIGVSIIKMNEGIDSGDVILRQNFAINNDDDYENLAPKLAQIGANLACEALDLLERNLANEEKQDDDKASICKKIKKEDCLIDFSQNAQQILNQIRALNGFMPAYFQFRGEVIKIFKAKIIKGNFSGAIGEMVDKNFVIKCGQDAIQPLEIQRPSKNRMKIEDFLRGFVF